MSSLIWFHNYKPINNVPNKSNNLNKNFIFKDDYQIVFKWFNQSTLLSTIKFKNFNKKISGIWTCQKVSGNNFEIDNKHSIHVAFQCKFLLLLLYT